MHLAVWQLLPNVSYWVQQTIAKEYRIQFNTHSQHFNGMLPTVVSAEQVPILTLEPQSFFRQRGHKKYVSLPLRESGLYSGYFLDPKKEQGFAPDSRSAFSEQNTRPVTRLVCHDRSTGRILLYRNPARTQEVPQICFQR